jgi:hypothetical protein
MPNSLAISRGWAASTPFEQKRTTDLKSPQMLVEDIPESGKPLFAGETCVALCTGYVSMSERTTVSNNDCPHHEQAGDSAIHLCIPLVPNILFPQRSRSWDVIISKGNDQHPRRISIAKLIDQ